MPPGPRMIRPNLWASPHPGKGKSFLTFSRVRNHARGPSNSERMKGDLCKIVICQHPHSFCHVLLSNSEEGSFSTLQILSPPGLLVLGFGEQLVRLKEQEVGGSWLPFCPHPSRGRGGAPSTWHWPFLPQCFPRWCSGKNLPANA